MPVLNIKNPEAYRLASDLSLQTGKSLTRVVLDALQNEAARILRHRPIDRARVKKIQNRYQAIPAAAGPLPASDDDLYDCNGLPY